MGFVKNGAPAHDLNQLMAQATAIAAKQDAHLIERARQKRREHEARMLKEERAAREKAEAEAKQKAIEEKKRQQALEQKRQQKRLSTQRTAYSAALKPKSGLVASSSRASAQKASMAQLLPEKKKPVHMSFEELMRKAKEQSKTNVEKSGTKTPISPTSKRSVSPPPNRDKNIPQIYQRKKTATSASSASSASKSISSSSNNSSASHLSARELAKQMMLEPPKKVISQKRDRLSISEVQRSLRHAKGKFSDDEEEDDKPRDKRLMPRRGSDTIASQHPTPITKAYTNGSRAAAGPYPPSAHRRAATSSLPPIERHQRPLSPRPAHARNVPSSSVPSSYGNRHTATASSSYGNRYTSTASPSYGNRHISTAPIKRPLANNKSLSSSATSSSQSRNTSNAAPVRRMPFTGKPIGATAPRTTVKRYHRDYEDEEDDELSSFIVSDDEVDEDPVYTTGRSKISAEISKIFRYDRSKYANEPVFSDDDMEAAASDVLKEEKRSERIARREDLIEEQKELERLKRRKKNL